MPRVSRVTLCNLSTARVARTNVIYFLRVKAEGAHARRANFPGIAAPILAPLFLSLSLSLPLRHVRVLPPDHIGAIANRKDDGNQPRVAPDDYQSPSRRAVTKISSRIDD